MPQLRDSRGNPQKSYRDLYRAERRYKKSAKKAPVNPKADETADFTITERERKQAPADDATEYYCVNCGEPINEGDAECATCGITLDWGAIK